MAHDGQEEKVQETIEEMRNMIANLTRRAQVIDEELERIREEQRKRSQRQYECGERLNNVSVDPMLEEFQRFNPEGHDDKVDYEMKEKLVTVPNPLLEGHVVRPPIMQTDTQGSVMVGSSWLGPTGVVGKKNFRKSKRVWKNVPSNKKMGGGSAMVTPGASTTIAQLCSKCGSRHGKRPCTHCYACGNLGHIARFCDQKRSFGPSPNLNSPVARPVMPRVLPLADKQKGPLP